MIDFWPSENESVWAHWCSKSVERVDDFVLHIPHHLHFHKVHPPPEKLLGCGRLGKRSVGWSVGIVGFTNGMVERMKVLTWERGVSKLWRLAERDEVIKGDTD